MTIVLFSRIYYDANSLDSFPEDMRQCLRMDYKGKYYEDFYRFSNFNFRLTDYNCIVCLFDLLYSNDYKGWQFKTTSTKTGLVR